MNDVDVRGILTREQFEEMAAPLLARVRLPLQQVRTQCQAFALALWIMAKYSIVISNILLLSISSFIMHDHFLWDISARHMHACKPMAARPSWTT